MSNEGRQAVARVLAQARTAVLFLHINADGDSVGSTLALAHALTRRGALCRIIYGDRYPQPYSFLPGSENITHWANLSPDEQFDVAILPDCSGIDRVGDAHHVLPRAAKAVNIDHHASNTGYGDVRWVDPRRSCVGEMVMEIVDDLGVEIDEDIALCLYTAIVTDTGSFAYESTTPTTHRYAARLLEAGVQPQEVAQQLYGNMSREAVGLLGSVLQTLRFAADGQIAWIVISAADRARHNAGPHDAEGLVNYPRNIAGVEVAISFYEEENGSVRVGLRSKRRVDVAQLAEQFGGGGHKRAAGCRHTGPLAAAVQDIVQAAEKFVSANGPGAGEDDD